jgi:hypothetical protein
MITSGDLTSEIGLAIDTSGKLYVANGPTLSQVWSPPSILVFDTAHGDAELPPITDPAFAFGGLVGVALDPSGKLYALEAGFAAWEVLVFDTSRGNAVLPPIRPVFSAQYNTAEQVAVDRQGKVYVASLDPYPTDKLTVRIFDTEHANVELPSISLAGPDYSIGGMTVDSIGRLYVSHLFSDHIDIFDRMHGNAPLAGITDPQLGNPSGLALDASGKLYVVCGDHSISIYDTAHGNAELSPCMTRTFRVMEEAPRSIDVKHEQSLWLWALYQASATNCAMLRNRLCVYVSREVSDT